MQTIAIDDPGSLSVSLFATRAKTAERIDVLFGMETPGDPRNIVLDGVPLARRAKGVRWGFYQITLWLCAKLSHLVVKITSSYEYGV